MKRISLNHLPPHPLSKSINQIIALPQRLSNIEPVVQQKGRKLSNMLEGFERLGPSALNVFIQTAQEKGLYQSIRNSKEFRKQARSVFSQSIDFSKIKKEIPARFSKLVTFQPSGTHLKQKSMFKDIQDIVPPKRIDVKLKKQPLIFRPNKRFNESESENEYPESKKPLYDTQISFMPIIQGNATFFSAQSEQISIEQLVIKRTNIVSKLPKLSNLIEKSDKFNDFFRKLCSIGSQKSESDNNGDQQMIKNLRLTKQNLKAHITKRYGKTISDRLMQFLELQNKTMHNIEFNAYLDLLSYSFFSLQNVSMGGTVYQVPNMYKLLFHLLDGGMKGFICEHDIFQVLQSLNQGKQGIGNQPSVASLPGIKQQNNCNYKIEISSYIDTDACIQSPNFSENFPRIKRSVYIESFQSDFAILTSEMEKIRIQTLRGPTLIQRGDQSINNRQFQMTPHESKKQFRSVIPSPRVDEIIPQKKVPGQFKKPISFFNQIVENITLNNKTAILLGQDIKRNSLAEQQAAQMLNNQGVQANIFSHFNPMQQLMKDKRQYSKEVSEIMKQQLCKQLTFEQFIRINKFEGDVPQFLDDLFQHMTTLGLKEILKKQATNFLGKNGSGKMPTIKHSVKLESQATSTISLYEVDYEELNLMKRQMTFLSLQSHFDECDLKRLINGFIMLSQNGATEKNLMQVFISQRSIVDNFQLVFKHQNQSLALRLYNTLAKGVSFNRLYLPGYLARLHPLFSSHLEDQMLFVFSLFDSDLDGLMGPRDISDVLENMMCCPTRGADFKHCDCLPYRELDKMYREYVNQNILAYRVHRVMIDFDFFIREIQYSCLIKELIDKLTLSWDRPSIFSHEPQDLNDVEILYRIDKQQYQSQISQIHNQGTASIVEKCRKKFQMSI